MCSCASSMDCPFGNPLMVEVRNLDRLAFSGDLEYGQGSYLLAKDEVFQ